MNITTVIFDFGNVISMPQEKNCFAEMSKTCGIPPEVLACAMGDLRREFDLGQLTAAQLYSQVLMQNGYAAEARDEALCKRLGDADLAGWFRINPKSSGWALGLKERGYKLGVLSNMPREFLERYRRSVSVFVQADSAVFSCEVGMVKPDPAIYELALQRLGAAAENAVFFDDLPANVEAARKLGMNAVLWESFEQAKAEFEKLVGGRKA